MHLLSHSMMVTLLALGLGAAACAEEYPADWFWGSARQREQHNLMVGKPMPTLALETVDGKSASMPDTKGKVVVIDFWATWCGPCVKAIPTNVELMKEFGDKGLTIVGIHDSKRGKNRMDALATKKEINYPLFVDEQSKSARTFNVFFWPTIAVVDQQGIVRAVGLQPSHLREVVEGLLGTQDTATTRADDAPEQFEAAFLEGKPERRTKLNAINANKPPKLEVTEWINSDALNWESLRGKIVVLDFWATWCGPCIGAIPKNNKLAAKYKDDVVLIGICHDRGSEKMAQVVKDKSIAYPVCRDIENTTIHAYFVDSYPDYYIFDRQGRLRVADCSNSKVEAAIEKLLAEEAPSK